MLVLNTSKDSDLQEGKLWEYKIPAENNAAVKEMSTCGIAPCDSAVILCNQFVLGEDKNETIMFGEDCGLQTAVRKVFLPSTFEDCAPPIF